MNKFICAVGFSLFAISVFAQDTLAPSKTRIEDRIQQERNEWSGKVADELANLPEDIQQKCQDAKNKADEFGRRIQGIKADSLTPEQFKAKLEELIAQKKADAEARIALAMQKIEEFKTAHRAEIEAAHADIRARIEAKRVELEAKRAEIEKKIAEKRAEIEAKKAAEK